MKITGLVMKLQKEIMVNQIFVVDRRLKMFSRDFLSTLESDIDYKLFHWHSKDIINTRSSRTDIGDIRSSARLTSASIRSWTTSMGHGQIIHGPCNMENIIWATMDHGPKIFLVTNLDWSLEQEKIYWNVNALFH